LRGSVVRRLLFAALALLFLLRFDLWLWDDPRRIAGVPVGLAYHVLYCFAVALVMGLVTLFAWPPHENRR
jgi:hypothetical protein